TEHLGNNIGLLTPSGTVMEFNVPTAGSNPFGITAGPDGNLWFVENSGESVGRITPTGTVTEYPLPPFVNPEGSASSGIAPGPDANLWFTEQGDDQVA